VTKNTNRHLYKKIPNDLKLQKQLLPNYPLGCKRILFHSEYYPTLALSHVELHSDKIIQVAENKIVTADGKSRQIDVWL
jgi:cation diffusion facilitator CzcD-associated flavoprotein CzcO